MADELPVLAGIEAKIVTRRGSRERRPSRKAAAMTEVETPADFAARMRDRFVLRGPRAPEGRKEGGRLDDANAEVSTDVSTDASPTSYAPGAFDDAPGAVDKASEDVADVPVAVHAHGPDDDASLVSIVSQSNQGLDLLTELRDKYSLDPAFQPILAKPGDFCNFEYLSDWCT